MKKIIKKLRNTLIGLGLLLTTAVASQTVQRTYYQDSLVQTAIKDGHIITFYNGKNEKTSSIKELQNGKVYFSNIPIWYVTEPGLTSVYYLVDNNWTLMSVQTTTEEGKAEPFHKGRCEGITKDGTRCKRKGNKFCWQHKTNENKTR